MSRVIYLLLIGSILLTSCGRSDNFSTVENTVQPTATLTQQALPSATEPKMDVMGTAIAADAATKAAGPTKPPTNTPRPITTLDPNVDNWWNDTVFYEIFVRSFQDSDGDGVGDIQGLIQKLDYLNDGDPTTTNDLGITGIWLMPIMESPSYHGYDVVNYYQVDQEYGTNADFLQLIDEAHKRGIKIIVDLVINHTSSQHPWFIASNEGDPVFRDYYIWSDIDPNYSGPWGQDVWYPGKQGQYYALFWSGMPDLDLTNPKVTQEIYDITEFWLTDMRADGFRMDAVRHLIEQGKAQENTSATHEWLYNYHQYYRSLSPGAFTVGETWTDSINASKYSVSENDIAFEFDLSEAYLGAANNGVTDSLNFIMKTVLRVYPQDQFGIFLTNHDQNRVMSALRDTGKAKVAASLLLTSPGVPFLYYGEEVGMLGTKPDEEIRLPMPWTGDLPQVGFTTGTPWRSPTDNVRTDNVAEMIDDPDSLWALYRDLIKLRSEHSALRSSQTFLIETRSRSLFAILRVSEDETLLIITNTHKTPARIELNDMTLDQSPISGNFNALSIFGNAAPEQLIVDEHGSLLISNVIEIGGQQTLIFSLTEE